MKIVHYQIGKRYIQKNSSSEAVEVLETSTVFSECRTGFVSVSQTFLSFGEDWAHSHFHGKNWPGKWKWALFPQVSSFPKQSKKDRFQKALRQQPTSSPQKIAAQI